MKEIIPEYSYPTQPARPQNETAGEAFHVTDIARAFAARAGHD
jgi:hypothetical protein